MFSKNQKYHILIIAVFFISNLFAARKVLIIGIDGVQADALRHSDVPTLRWLKRNGFGTFSTWHQDITISGPSWSSILCGVYHPKHGVKNNSFEGKNYSQYPMLPLIAKQYKPDLLFGMYMEWNKLYKNSLDQGWDQIIKGRMMGTEHTARKASEWINHSNLDLYFVYFGKADYIGHATGFSKFNPLYRWALEDIDAGVHQLINVVQSRESYFEEDWLILLTTDHGGAQHNHGGLSNAEREVFWIAYSDRILKNDLCGMDCGNLNDDCNPYNYHMKNQVPVQPDIAVTALHHLLYGTGCETEALTSHHFDGISWLGAMGLCNERIVMNQVAYGESIRNIECL